LAGGLALLGLLLAGCKGERGGAGTPEHPFGQPVQVKSTYQGSYPIKVLCTVGMVADLARNVGGPRVEVTQLLGEGTDPHTYKSGPGDLRKLTEADLILYNGLHLEGKMADTLARAAQRRPAFAVTEYLPPEVVRKNEEGQYDPHLWFDVSAWSKAAGIVCEILEKFDPPHAAEYRENCRRYQQRLANLHDYARKELASVPRDRRVLVTAHDAFRYFGHAYDVEVKGIQGISTEAEAGVNEINALVDFLVSRKIKAVFVESSVNEKNVRSLIQGCRDRGHEVKIGGELFSDAMGKPGTPEGTYEGMIRHNVDTIVKALR
jgi:manganese/zinc/iron transport system substrate-binding protein